MRSLLLDWRALEKAGKLTQKTWEDKKDSKNKGKTREKWQYEKMEFIDRIN